MAKSDSSSLVSVVIPIYNAAPYLDQALKSVQDQAYRNIEIICVNDGSTDDSLEIINAHAEKDSRIRVIDKANEGYGASMNRGITESRGEWIAVLEPDDWIEPGMYRDMLDFAAQFEDTIDVVKTPYWRITYADSPRERKLNCPYRYRIKQSKEPGDLHDIIPVFRNHPSIWSAIYRKQFLDQNEIRFVPFPGSGWADNPFLVETLIKAQSILYLNRPYYCYREETEEKAADFHSKNPLLPFERWNQMMDILEKNDIEDPDILMAHYSRGFMYMSGVLEQHSLDEPEVMAATRQMFSRMRPELVQAFPKVSPGVRRMFAELTDAPAPKINYPRYCVNLIDQTITNARTIGMSETVHSVKRYLTKYKGRTGGR